MAYRLQRGTELSTEVRRVIVDELDYAAKQLRPRTARQPEAIHEARKSIKKARAAIRLIEAPLGPVASRERRRLGGLGRRLSPIRDADVLVETLEGLRKDHGGESLSAAFAGAREILETKRRALDGSPAAAPHSGTRRLLLAAAARIRQWNLSSDAFTLIATGLKQTFRRGREAMDNAVASPTDENYHEWRKRLKEHWYHVRLLEDLWPEVMGAYARGLKSLETSLGDDHNLVLLRTAIEEPARPRHSASGQQALLKLIAKQQEELRGRALAEGLRVYAQKPGSLGAAFGRLFDVWKSSAPVQGAGPLPVAAAAPSETHGGAALAAK